MPCTQTAGGLREDEFDHMVLERGSSVVSGQHADLHEPVQRYRRLTRQGLPIALVEEIEGVGHTRGEFIFRSELAVRGSTAAARPS